MLPTLTDRADAAQSWWTERRHAAQDWWADRTPSGKKKILAGCAALGTVALIGIVAGTAGGSGGSSGASGASASAGSFELGATSENRPPQEECVLPGPYCEFEGSDGLDVCLEAIDEGLTGCTFEGLCAVREECVCYDVPDTAERTCESFTGPPADCDRFGACEFNSDGSLTCNTIEACLNDTGVPSASPSVAPSALAPSASTPTTAVTPSPSSGTTGVPSASPSMSPSPWPTHSPTAAPVIPAYKPTMAPTKATPGWTAGR